VRSRRALIQYTIQTSEDLIERIIAAEREAAGVTKRYVRVSKSMSMLSSRKPLLLSAVTPRCLLVVKAPVA
jgi:hypothetical protein